MKVLVGMLVLCGTLSLMAGPAVANEVVSLNCQKGNCKFSEELGPVQTHEYRGACAGKNDYGFRMVCHAVKGTTCTRAGAWGDNYWSCTCTNWNATERKYVSIDLECED